ncbi:MAG: class I tRNA ligase family protein, partial [bacterium]|nr:class I tRNA ligase family protein [bacterium]
AVESKQTEIMPERFEKIYYHWIDNLRDWCISRQIWFGHRIPAWFKGDKVKVSVTSPGEGWVQDEDTLDTWFSSGLWTFSTLGWPYFAQSATKGKPGPENDLANYHPTAVLETGYDILFFWVARMILMSTFLRGEVPFMKVYLHGLVRDGHGRKMSKSLGNIIDPLTMIEKYGADATRLSLIIGAAPGTDLKLSEDRVRGYKHFANKLWNITRFVLENTDYSAGEMSEDDANIVKTAEGVAVIVSDAINNFRLDLAADAAYHFTWDTFAAKVLEDSKIIFRSNDENAKRSRSRMLNETLVILLKLLHPFMPFVTEAIWQELPKKPASTREDSSTRGGDNDLLMVAKWPV